MKSSRDLRKRDTQETVRFRVVIVYDTYRDGLRAWELSERMVKRFEGRAAVHRDFWKFDLLQDTSPEWRLESVLAVAEADVVIIASEGVEPLPDWVVDWISSWPARWLSSAPALVASLNLLTRAATAGSPVLEYLRLKAARAGMEFIGEPGGGPVPVVSGPRSANLAAAQLPESAPEQSQMRLL
jgi:hypothetical protein